MRQGRLAKSVLLAAAVVHVGVIRREEAHLEALFGEAYLAYRDRVRRWL
jgi:protein-S-isoprenylcysteine O-methyltransferase Ste14